MPRCLGVFCSGKMRAKAELIGMQPPAQHSSQWSSLVHWACWCMGEMTFFKTRLKITVPEPRAPGIVLSVPCSQRCSHLLWLSLTPPQLPSPAHPHAQLPVPPPSLMSWLTFLLPAFCLLPLAACPLQGHHPALFSSSPAPSRLSPARTCTGSLSCPSKCAMSWWRKWNTMASGQEAGMR